MSNEMKKFIDKISEFLPAIKEQYTKSNEITILDTVFIEDILMPQLISLLDNSENNELLTKIFLYIEEIIRTSEYIKDILSVTMFEILGNDIVVLRKAEQYMGEHSKHLQIEADKQLGRVQIEDR